MNVVRSTLSSRRVNTWLPWIAGLVLAAGVIAFLVAYFGNTADSQKSTFSNQPARTPQVVKNVPLEPAARKVAGKFILTAVLRKNLDQAWPLVTDQLRGGLTFKQWMTGDIPVIPFNAPIWRAPIKVDYSHQGEAELQVILVPKANKNDVKATLFIMVLKKVGKGSNARWLVDYWDPKATAPIQHPN